MESVERVAYVWCINKRDILCTTYVDGRIDESLRLRRKDLRDFPNLLRGLYEHKFDVHFSKPSV